jgi:hypothetical protein
LKTKDAVGSSLASHMKGLEEFNRTQSKIAELVQGLSGIKVPDISPLAGLQSKIFPELPKILGAVQASKSFSELSSVVGVPRTTLIRQLDELKVEIKPPHWRGGNITHYTQDTLLTYSDARKNETVKKFILDNDLIPYVCSECGQQPVWNGKPLTLELEHIDGDPLNNHLENLTFLCGHCHSQTDTYKGKKNRKDVG